MAFLAQPEEVAVVRRCVRAHLENWGAAELVDSAELCVSELVSNVVTHVGEGTPVRLGVSVAGNRLRIEVRDPDSRALPVVLDASGEAETGRGMALIDALTERWGVRVDPEGKVTWCELARATSPTERGHDAGASQFLDSRDFSGQGSLLHSPRPSRLEAMAAEVAAIDVIAAVLHWTRAHGRDADDVLDRALSRFEAQVDGMGGSV